MRTNKWAWAAICATFLTISSTSDAQVASSATTAIRAMHELSIGFQGQIDPSKTTEKTWESDGGKKVVTTKTEYDKDGHVVRKTTTTTDYSGRDTDKNRKVTKKKTEVEDYDSKGKLNKKTTTTEESTKTGSKKTVVEDPGGSMPARKTEEEEYDKDGNLVKKSTFHKATGNGKASETEYKDGKPTKETRWDANGNKESETEFDENGKPKKETRYNDDGTKTEFEDFEKDGKPHKVTTYHPNGQKKSEGKVDDKGNVTEKKEFDEKGREVKSTNAEGVVETTEYEGSTDRIRRKTVTHPDGSKSVTDYKDGHPEPTRKYDPKGHQVSNNSTGMIPTDAIIIAPNGAVAGQLFQFTVATLSGQVVANQPVTLDGGAMGKIEATTDLNGVVTAKAPDNWRTMRIVAGTVSAGILIDALSGGARMPKVTNPPSFVQPGGIVNIPGQGFSGSCDGEQVTIGGQPAKVLASSPTGIKAIVPSGLKPGVQTFEVSQDGNVIDSRTVECVNIQWDQLKNSLVVGQSAQRTLRITGTTKPVNVLIQDRMGDSVTVKSTGVLKSTGGTNNTLVVNLVATSPGTFAIPAEVADGKTDYEKDLENAERAKKEAAGWEDSAKTQSSDALKEAFERAARNLRMAGADWEDAADARMRGNDKKAEELEKAAADREAAAKAFGEKDYEKGKACEDSARMHEREAGRK